MYDKCKVRVSYRSVSVKIKKESNRSGKFHC